MPGEDLFLTMQWQMIAILAYGNMSDEASSGQPLVDGLSRLVGAVTTWLLHWGQAYLQRMCWCTKIEAGM